jgi:hypothetical protein
MRVSSRRLRTQSGFALLLVFAMAAAAAILIYLEMPRVAFENMRGKEEMLVERGEQYQRAIQLYVRKNNKYPQTLEDLETTNNVRFLRRRYKDPMTGEDEWRLIHIDNMGQYTDSLIHKKEEEKKKAPSVLASNVQGIGDSAEYIPNAQGQGVQNPYAMARRPSEIRAQQGGGAGGEPLRDSVPNEAVFPSQPDSQQNQQNQQNQGQYSPGQPPQDPYQPGQPRIAPGTSGVDTRVQQAPPGFGTGGSFGSSAFGQTQPGQQTAGRLPGFPSQSASSQAGGQIGSPIGASGMPAPPGILSPRMGGQTQQGQQPPGQQGGGFGFGGGFGSGAIGSGGQQQYQPQPGGSQSGFQGSFQAGQQGGQQSGFSGSSPGGSSFGGGSFGSSQPGQGAPNQAIQAIRGILSGGRPNPQQQAGAGAAIQGGIAGVASKRDMQAIRVYNERSNYKEWEFLFDMKKELEARGKKANPGTPQMGGPDSNRQGTMGPGQGGMAPGQGSTSGFGGFGSSGTTRPAPGAFGSGSSFGRQ